MLERKETFRTVQLSLNDLIGEAYTTAVCEARVALTGEESSELRRQCAEPVDFFPPAFHNRLRSLLPAVGTSLCSGLATSASGASSQAFTNATNYGSAPLNGYGWYRIGEDGRLAFMTKSEHYHAPVGHAFPGYQLLETARSIGIPNATHNNTRGYITRLLEEELVRAAHGLEAGESLDAIRRQSHLDSVNCVLNLETGSLAVEAALKMLLARFYTVQDGAAQPPYQGRIPVFLVMGNDEGGAHANYHGTTVLTQVLRGMWPELAAKLDEHQLYTVCTIRPNAMEELEQAIVRYERPPYKVAGFFHEIVMMNYGARLLSREFLSRSYELCAAHDIPTVVDEIQSCLWAPDLFLFREYGLRPSAVAVGKGFPGGEYPASRLIFSSALDSLPLFGALVTNGQEEIASLAYLVTMRWAQANADITRRIGEYFEERLGALAATHSSMIHDIPGNRHLCGIAFHELPTAQAFVARLTERGLDVSVQTYKADCPPVVLTKLPLIACQVVVDFIIECMADVLASLETAPAMTS